MKEHATIGGNLLAHVPALEQARPIVEAHHERYDGTGYPKRLKGDDIPFAAQIVGLADAFHAMVSPPAYRPAMSRAAALAELKRCAGTQFNTAVVEAFVELMADEARGVRDGGTVRGAGLVPQRAAEPAVVHQRVN